MSRRELREQIFKLLFRVEFNSLEDMPEQECLFFEDEEAAQEKDADYISDKYHMIQQKLSEIDQQLNERTQGWDTARMSKVDLTILRLAVYEIHYDDSVPTGVAINEAVELAKKFGQDASPGFVNGILAKFA
ncbi:MAG: transcription antitermination factor NusB [Lachnospiraceae bacterium]|nr:transcription antitermination factor NusB [Lachnospiraceae bacterium]